MLRAHRLRSVSQASIAILGSVGNWASTAFGSTSLDFSGLSPADGDLAVVLAFHVGSSNSIPGISTSGYTTLASNGDHVTDNGYYVSWLLSYKVIGAGESSVTVTEGDGDVYNVFGGRCFLLRGADATNPIDVAVATNQTTAAFRSLATPSVTPVTAGALILSGLVTKTGALAISSNGSLLAIGAESASRTGGTEAGGRVMMGARKDWASGSISGGTWTYFGAFPGDSGQAESFTLAVRPA